MHVPEVFTVSVACGARRVPHRVFSRAFLAYPGLPA